MADGKYKHSQFHERLQSNTSKITTKAHFTQLGQSQFEHLKAFDISLSKVLTWMSLNCLNQSIAPEFYNSLTEPILLGLVNNLTAKNKP